MSLEIARECVARGAARFDETKPDWHNTVNEKLIRMGLGSTDRCVGTHVFGSYSECIRELGCPNHKEQVAFGLTIDRDPKADSATADELDAAWSELIRNRRREDESIIRSAERILANAFG